MIKVCYIISGDLWAGAEAMAYNLLKSLKKRTDLELSVILLNKGKTADKIKALDIPLDILDERKLSFLQIFTAMKEIIGKQAPHILHSHRYKENFLAYLVSRRSSIIKRIATQHGLPEIYRKIWDLKLFLTSKLNFLLLSICFHRIVAVSRNMREVLINKYGLPPEGVDVIYNGIDILNTLSSNKKDGPFTIGSSGRLYPVKDYPLMVGVAGELAKKLDNIRFELAGEGPDRGALELLIKEYDLEEIFKLRGFVNDIFAFYRDLDIYINTSLHEGMPISILEAMACGLPVIAPDTGGLKEIIENGSQGYLMASRDPKDFADICLRLHENESLRKEMGLAAKEKIIREFSSDRMGDLYYQLYGNLTNTCNDK